jgi:hypothetical protein
MLDEAIPVHLDILGVEFGVNLEPSNMPELTEPFIDQGWLLVPLIGDVDPPDLSMEMVQDSDLLEQIEQLKRRTQETSAGSDNAPSSDKPAT